MKYFALPLLLLLATSAVAAAPAVQDTSYREANGARVQQLELVIDAPAAKIWDALTTDAGFMGWGAPVAHVTLGNDGMIEASYRLSAKIGDADTIRNQIVAYLPGRLLVRRKMHVPKGAPFKPDASAKIRTVIVLD